MQLSVNRLGLQEIFDKLKLLETPQREDCHALTTQAGSFGYLQVINEALPALQELKKEGLVRNIGFSGLPLAIYKRILDR